ncbi:copper chaperone PCu(A)C [Phycicoccus sp. CSK15P-2]|uniref:copper chaperone PCu(A)C n=1 Tax=Phycicoccus sp. CSK15P-2 TaxID=2807627 RepID=UPI001951D2BD|nr:copper chaperone PCu(A)C [Phycicoccus sp. CSK15P-2]MBM6404690.1 copper chaperone PCu(A)C [Phycicoccus sp. CSK15P-2]
MRSTMPTTRRVAIGAVLAALTATGVAACGSSESPSGGTDTAATGSAALTLEDGWVKEVTDAMSSPSPTMSMPSESPSADGDHMHGDGDHMHGADMSAPMTAMFGTLHNGSDEDVTVTGGSTPVAGTVELHETVRNDSGETQMQPKADGFVVPAGGDLTLQPGGDHVMLMDLTGPLANGSEATITLQTSAGDVTLTVPVRAFSGAEESYAPSPSSS